MNITFKEIYSELPQNIQRFVGGIPEWSYYNLLHERERLRIFSRKNDKNEEWVRLRGRFRFHRETLSCLALLFLLEKILTENAKLNESALNIYKELGVKSFKIGNAVFSKSSPAFKLPILLSQGLEKLITSNVFLNQFKACKNIFEVAEKYRTQEIGNEFKAKG